MKFTEAGSVTLRVERHLATTGFDGTPYAVAFAVADTGIGIPEDKLRLIFEAFQQADGTTSRRYGGTGLGPVDLPRDRPPARRRDPREVGRGRGQHVHAAAAGDVRAAGARRRPSDGGAAARRGRLQRRARSTAPAPVPAAARPSAAAAPRRCPSSSRSRARPAPEVPDDRDRIAPGDRVVLIVSDTIEESDEAMGRAARPRPALHRRAGRRGEPDPRAGAPDRRRAAARRRRAAQPAQAAPAHAAHPRVGGRRPVVAPRGAAGRRGRLRRAPGQRGVRSRRRSAGSSSALDRQTKRLLLVEDDETAPHQRAPRSSAATTSRSSAVGSSAEALERLEADTFDCMVLDLKLPDGSGFELLEKLKDDERHRDLPVIIHTGKALTRKEETRLKKYAGAIVVKDAASPERLLDETALFLHRAPSALTPEHRRMLDQLHQADAVLQGRKVLIVDDDVRNVFALTSVLEGRGMEVLFAENGREGIETLEANPDVDLVLMDVMMPEMDGYEAMRAIRAPPALRGPPDHRAHGEGDAGRPREVDRRRARRTTSPSRSTPTSCCR